MESVSISPKFQVVIPKDIRELFKLKAGEKMVMIPYEGRIEMVMERSIKSMRGFLRGMDTEIKRDRSDRV